ncbi:MAG TPA: potassium transporter TrkG, partial [Myxococcota bacterium]|nr:potassium transporter TrkG [Myxococcota bacterium]
MGKWAWTDKLSGTGKPALPKLLSALLIGLSVLILILEFFYDLKRETLLQKVVMWLDYGLVFLFFVSVIRRVLYSKYKLFQLLAREKADSAYVLLIVACLFIPRLAAGLVIFRLLIALFMKFLDTQVGAKLLSSISWRPSQTLAISFVALIAGGTILLTFPAATTDGKGAPLINALFTMTSASCVAGLTVYDIGAAFTRFGQAVILFGMQVGGLGIMLLSAAFAVLVGGNIPSRRQAGLREVLDISRPEGLRRLIRAVTATTIITEFVGVVLLFFLLQDEIPRISDRLWWSVFHVVSAFCNVGMSLSHDSLIPFVNDTAILLVFM